jgi:hypothetical protein
VLRRTIEPKRDEVREGQRKIYNEELHGTQAYSSPNTIKMNKSRMIGCAGRTAQMGEDRTAYKVPVVNP